MKNSLDSEVGSFPFLPPPKLLSLALLRSFLSSKTDCSKTGRRELNSSLDTPVKALSSLGFLNALNVFIRLFYQKKLNGDRSNGLLV